MVFSYKIFPTGYKKGIIEVIQAKTLAKILTEDGSVLAYLDSLSNDECVVKRYKENYFKSCGKNNIETLNIFYLRKPEKNIFSLTLKQYLY